MHNRRSLFAPSLLGLALFLSAQELCFGFLPSSLLLRPATFAPGVHRLRSVPVQAVDRRVTMVSSAAADKQAQDFAHIQEKESAVPRIAGPLKNRYFALR
eukprot:3328598-Rhodomonas_salina.1